MPTQATPFPPPKYIAEVIYNQYIVESLHITLVFTSLQLVNQSSRGAILVCRKVTMPTLCILYRTIMQTTSFYKMVFKKRFLQQLLLQIHIFNTFSHTKIISTMVKNKDRNKTMANLVIPKRSYKIESKRL